METVNTVDGLITVLGSAGPKEATDRLVEEVQARGMTVFARIDHAAGARATGLVLRPTEFLNFRARGSAADAEGPDDQD
jgi:uncharacterized protein (DUF302 family)